MVQGLSFRKLLNLSLANFLLLLIDTGD